MTPLGKSTCCHQHHDYNSLRAPADVYETHSLFGFLFRSFWSICMHHKDNHAKEKSIPSEKHACSKLRSLTRAAKDEDKE
mmetsp:Transcript_111748/g.193675  ORF Transcript_111748/g.193675 Transcript_111748/m.193675 type:complete len:80 (-) Transcript_111748:1785-2024(-)